MNTREPKNHGHTTAPRRVTRAHHDTIASAPRPKTETQLQELMSTVLSGFARDQWSKLNTIPFGECAPIVTLPPPFPVAIGAINSELTLSCDVRAGAPAEINVVSDSSPMHDGRTWEQRRALTNGDSLVLEPTLTGRGPCDSGAINSMGAA